MVTPRDAEVRATPQDDESVATPQALSYDEVKTQRFESVVGVKIYGVPLEVDEQKSLISGRRFQPIIGCLCVWDSPDSPCPCTGDMIFWLPVEQIIMANETDRKSVRGYRLHMFTVSSDAEVLVEDRVRSFSARDLHQALAGGGVPPGIVLSKKPSKVVVEIVSSLIVGVIDWVVDNWDVPESGLPPDAGEGIGDIPGVGAGGNVH
jgi:hypothetical protein